MLILFAHLTLDSIRGFLDYAKTKKIEWKLPGTLLIGIVNNKKQETHFIGDEFLKNTRLPFGSLTESLTFTIVGALAKKKVIDVDDSIKKYLLDFPFPKMTIRDILMQRTKIEGCSGHHWIKLGLSFLEIYEKLKLYKAEVKLDFNHEDRDIFFTSLLEKIIEKATHKKFDDVAREYLFSPANLWTGSYKALSRKIWLLLKLSQICCNSSYRYVFKADHTYTHLPLDIRYA